jgi:HEAT repeat protein
MIAALNAAVTSANKDILQLIKSCINSSDFRVKAAAVRSLGRNGRMASNLIDSALADESPAVRKSAVEALEFADEDNIDNKLTISLNSSDESIVRSAFAVIRARHRESFLKKLLPYTKYSIATIRIEAIDTLLTLDSKDTVLLTDDLLKESDASIRQSVIHLLVIHNTDRIESKIKAMLSGDNEEIKTDVIIALRDSHTHYALPLLIEMIGKENMHIQKEVLATLTNVSGKNYSVNKVDWQNWYTNEYQRK